MTYIAQNTKQARLWVDAVSKSLKIDKSMASQMYARLCEFKNWDQLVGAINRESPSPTDENVTKDILETRKQFYIDRLVDEFGMAESMADYIINKVSPSSGRKPQRFSIDTESLYGRAGEDSINLHDMLKEFGMDSDDGFNTAIEEFARRTIGDSLPDDFSFENFGERMRISKPIDPGVWYDVLFNIGWGLLDASFREEYVYGEESFIAIKNGEGVPVYITSLVRAPSDFDDEMANSVMSVVEDHALDVIGSDEAILFWGQPSVKKIDGKYYNHFGMYYTDGQWHEFLINKDTTITGLFNQHNEMESIEEPPESLSDTDCMLAIATIKVMNGIDQTKQTSFSTFGMKSGWNQLMPSDKSDE